MPKITIDNHEIDVPEGTTIFQAAELLGIEVPHFCYHARLDIAGNCRMCLVDVEGAPKPVASCAMPVSNNMVVHTKTDRAQVARKGVMEFLLINHPLDCPICDQGGECDLQDIALTYGADRSRYEENKRAVKDKYMGPLVRTHMTRCIHCTRCVRFSRDVAGIPELGTLNRGEDLEITNVVEQTLSSELSGNIIDLCPVGALTSKPYAFRGRPWELTKTETIDVLDAVGSNIRVDCYGPKVMRVLPRLNEDINEEWISDKTRFACDGLSQQRLDTPYLRIRGRLEPCSWEEAFEAIEKQVKKTPPKKMGAIVGDLADCESMTALKDLWARLGSPHIDCRQAGEALTPEVRAHYLFNTTIAGIEDSDLCLIVGAHPRFEAPILNARIRKRVRREGYTVARIGQTPAEPFELTYPVKDIGEGAETLTQIQKGVHAFCKALSKAKKPMMIVGPEVLQRSDAASILALAGKIAEKYGFVTKTWNGFNILHRAAARVGGLDLGLVPGKGGKSVKSMLKAAEGGDIELLYLLGADEINPDFLKNPFVIYQGHHGDAGARAANVVLPGAAYTEKTATYVNTEGRVQRTQRALFPPGEAKEDWRILRALSETLGVALTYNTVDQLWKRMSEINPIFKKLDEIEPSAWKSVPTPKTGKCTKAPFTAWNQNFYMTDPISRSSVTMAKCSQKLGGNSDGGGRMTSSRQLNNGEKMKVRSAVNDTSKSKGPKARKKAGETHA